MKKAFLRVIVMTLSGYMLSECPINAARYGVSTQLSYVLSNQPCMLCARAEVNAGVIKVVHQENLTMNWHLILRQAGVKR